MPLICNFLNWWFCGKIFFLCWRISYSVRKINSKIISSITQAFYWIYYYSLCSYAQKLHICYRSRYVTFRLEYFSLLPYYICKRGARKSKKRNISRMIRIRQRKKNHNKTEWKSTKSTVGYRNTRRCFVISKKKASAMHKLFIYTCIKSWQNY